VDQHREAGLRVSWIAFNAARPGDELTATLAKMFRAEASAADANPEEPEATRTIDRGRQVCSTLRIQAVRILKRPEPYTRERFEHTYQ